MKISDNVATDENEPEVLFDGSHHADEHMAAEMTLRIMHWLVDGYGTRHPDHQHRELARGLDRLPRQPGRRRVRHLGRPASTSGARTASRRPGSGYIGTDLNRNYGYRWGGGGHTSTNPAAITYRGPSAFSAPETRAMRDFLASRVVDGKQQIRVGITFHEYGRLVMWPYGYTYTNVPADMTADDHAALVYIGKKMASTNGYKPEQASDLYISSGTSRDYLYGTYRTFSYTFEMSVKDYPDDALIAAETGRNKEAVLYLMERAWCPLSVRGATVDGRPLRRLRRRHGGPPRLDRDPDGTDTAPSTGRFVRSNPAADDLGRREAARDDDVGLDRPRHRGARGRQRERLRPRWPHLDPERPHQAARPRPARG